MIAIKCNGWTAEVTPEIGGGLASFRHSGIDILRAATPEALAAKDPLGLGSFPLVPYPGRIRKGVFGQGDRDIQVPKNHPSFAYPLHGDGWLAAWKVVKSTPESCTIRYRHDRSGWPWRYSADLTYALAPEGLTMTLAVTNDSETTMPVGLGQHPYFLPGPGCAVTIDIDTVLWPAPDLIADLAGPVPPEWKFGTGHMIGSVPLDHGFAGWRGAVFMSRSDLPFRIRLAASSNASFLQIYIPDGAPFFCVEPQTCMANAVNQESLGWNGLIHLPPRQTATLESTITADKD